MRLSLKVSIPLSFLFLPLFFGSTALLAQEEIPTRFTILDWDGDGTSDLTLLTDQADGSKNELVVSHIESTTGELFEAEFGASEDTSAIGDYDGDGITDLTIVQEGEADLSWITKGSQDTNPTVTLGLLNDYIVRGCDFSGDGIVDEAIYRTDVGLYYLDANNGVNLIDLSFQSGETPTYMTCGDIDGDGNWETIFILQNDSTYRLAVYNLSGEQIFESPVKQPKSLFILDYDGNGILDIGLLRALGKRGKKTRLEIYTGDANLGFSLTSIKIRGGKNITDADALYTAKTASWQVIYYKRGKFFLPDTNGGRILRLNLPSIKGDELLHPQQVSPTGSIPGGDDLDGVCDSNIEDIRDGANGRLAKNGDSGGWVVLMTSCDGYRATKVKILDPTGRSVLFTMVSTGLANPDGCGLRAHFRDYEHRGSFYPRNIILLVKGNDKKNHCYRVDNPSKRQD